ncbi:MAG: TadG family pilus assembly protein, partial [Pararhizobium sp.]
MAPRGPHARLRRLARSRAGNVAIIAAASLPLLVGALALGVDWSYLGYQKRRAQADTDLAAISAAAALSDPAEALRQYAADNGFDVTVADEAADAAARTGDAMTYVLGHYEPAPDVAHEKRFVPGALPANAVRVTLHRKADLGFARAFMAPPDITTVAIAGRDAEAAFSIGSRLASLNGGLLNAVLGGLLGTSLNLEVMDYRALIDADVDAFGFLQAMATRLHLSGATYDDVLASRLSIGTMLSALAETNGVSATARLALRRLSQAAAGSRETVDLARLLDLGNAGRDPVGSAGLSAGVGVLDLISAAAAVADGEHQVAIDLGAR